MYRRTREVKYGAGSNLKKGECTNDKVQSTKSSTTREMDLVEPSELIKMGSLKSCPQEERSTRRIYGEPK